MKALTEAFEQLQIPWEQDMEEKFVGYMEGILEWNEKINLTAIKDRDEFIVKHFSVCTASRRSPSMSV